jgi:hypothetical protein
MKLSYFHKERKRMLGLSQNFRNQWIWVVFIMSKRQCWDWFWSNRKPMKLSCFCNKRKPMLGLFWSFENKWIWVTFVTSEIKCWDSFKSIHISRKLSCFRNEWKPILGLFLKYSKTNEIELLSQWVKVNVGIVFEVLETNKFEVVFVMSESQCWDCFQSFRNQWIFSNINSPKKTKRMKKNWGIGQDNTNWKSWGFNQGGIISLGANFGRKGKIW